MARHTQAQPEPGFPLRLLPGVLFRETSWNELRSGDRDDSRAGRGPLVRSGCPRTARWRTASELQIPAGKPGATKEPERRSFAAYRICVLDLAASRVPRRLWHLLHADQYAQREQHRWSAV